MEKHQRSSVALFLAAVRKRLNQRKISFEDFINECKLKNKNKISVFQFAIIVQRINCGSSFFIPRELFCQVNQRKEFITIETFRTLLLKASKIPLQNLQLSLAKSQGRNKQKTAVKHNKLSKAKPYDLAAVIQKKRKYYSQIGLQRLAQFVSSNSARPKKLFDDCDLDQSGFIDRNEFNKFLVASEIFQFKDKDVRRYLITDVFEKLKTEKITKKNFFQNFVLKDKRAFSFVKKLEPIRTKILSHSVQFFPEKATIIPINHRRRKNKKRKAYLQGAEYLNEEYIQVEEYGGEQREAYEEAENQQGEGQAGYQNQGDDADWQDQDDDAGYQDQGDDAGQQFYDDASYDLTQLYGISTPYAGYVDPGAYGLTGPIVPGKIGPTIPLKPVPGKPKPYDNPEIIQPKPQPFQPVLPMQPMQPIRPLPQPIQPKQQLIQPAQPSQPCTIEKFSEKFYQFYRFGAPKYKDLTYCKEFEQLLNSNTKFVDKKNPKIKPKYTYKTAAEIFKMLGLKGRNGSYSLFSESAETRNQNRRKTEFSSLIQAEDIKQGGLGDCYFLGAMASIAYDYPQILAQKMLFQVNPVNYYVTKLFIDGQWKYIKTDDKYATFNEDAAYCRPRQAQIWVMLIQKCFAKVYDDYSIIDGGTEVQAFFVLTGAFSETISMTENQDYTEIKNKISQADKLGYLMATSGHTKMQAHDPQYLEKMGLVKGHAYSLLSVTNVGKELLVKLRNPWGFRVYQGDWSFNSDKWTPKLRKQLNFQKNIENGIFYMSWNDYTYFFGYLTICKIHPTFVHTSFRMTNNKRKSNYIQMKVATKGSYQLFICLQSPRKMAKQYPNYSFSPKRIILMRKNPNSGKFQYVSSAFNYDKQFCVLETQLEVGTYTVSAKVQWTNGWDNHQCFLVSYGCENVTFQAADRSIAHKFKAEMIQSYALLRSPKANKKEYKSYNIVGVTSQWYLNAQEGIQFVKVLNRGNKKVKINFTFDLQSGIKVIKPNTSNWKQVIKTGEYALIGFFLTGGPCLYNFQESLEYL